MVAQSGVAIVNGLTTELSEYERSQWVDWIPYHLEQAAARKTAEALKESADLLTATTIGSTQEV